MASTEAARALQSSRLRPSAARYIVPAIPLPYVQKRKQNSTLSRKVEQAPRSSPTSHPASMVSPTAPDVSPIVAPDFPPIVTNGTSSTDESLEVLPEPGLSNAAASTIGEMVEPRVEETPGATPQESMAVEALHQNLPVDSMDQQASPIIASHHHASDSRSSYNVPPAFVPTSQGYSNPTTVTADSVRLPEQPQFGGSHAMHAAHPSAGSLVFGGYPDSNNSSPAPPLSAGSQQHLSQIRNEGGRSLSIQHRNGGHMHTFSNGYSSLAPPGYYPPPDGYLNQHTGPDMFARRQMVSFGPPEGYTPSGTPTGMENQRFPHYEPGAPRSFHGSQSSIPNEHEANIQHFHPQYSTAVISNGSNGHVEDVHLYHQPRPKGSNAPQTTTSNRNGPVQAPMVHPQMLSAMDNFDGLVEYLQAQFSEPQFADYTLELRYSDDRASPVRMPGHNILFARSPTLKNLMTTQAASNSDGITPRTLFIETDDRFLRSDGFWMAVQRLYGGPLLDPGASITANIPTSAQLSPSTPGSHADRFELALGYAAAGQILQMPPVVNRGIEIASHFVSWLTLETALDFALDGGLGSQWTTGHSPFGNSPTTYGTYGPAVNMLIHSTLNYIITSFPPDFELDISVSEPLHHRRLPVVPDSRPTIPNPRLSSIKFGDHPSEESVRLAPSHSTFSILSKVLLSLPFPLLKYVLQSSRLGNVYGWATRPLREKVMYSVIEERERRRNRVRDSRSISNADRKANARQWEVVGWQESVIIPYQRNETPTLVETWVEYELPEGT